VLFAKTLLPVVAGVLAVLGWILLFLLLKKLLLLVG
jgi:hypothetical protein